MELILASASPRRKEILKNAGYFFTVINSGYSENGEDVSPEKTVQNYAYQKAKSVFDSLTDKKGKAVLGADTIVSFNGEIIGKPNNADKARKTLLLLSGKTHCVYTGYSIITEKETVIGYDVSEVIFNELSEDLIKKYVDSGKPLDKAGSYGIQDGYGIVKDYRGSLSNIVGLPIEKIKPLLDSMGIKPN